MEGWGSSEDIIQMDLLVLLLVVGASDEEIDGH